MANNAPSSSRRRSMTSEQRQPMSQSLRRSFSRNHEARLVRTLSLLRSMLPDGWDCSRDSEYGIQSDGLYLRSSPSGNNGDDRLRMVRANLSFKISSLIPIVNSTRPELQWDGNSAHSVTLSPPTSLSRGTSSESSSGLDYVYYFEVFLISGTFSIGFESDNTGGVVYAPESIGLHVSGDLTVSGVRIPNWTQPFQNGDTIGCGVVVGSKARYFFTRNGDEIDAGNFNCIVTSIQTALIPCVGVSSTAETVLRTNFGFHSEHRFLWKGDHNVRIISHMSPSSAFVDDSIRSDDAFLQTNLVRGHTVPGVSTSPLPTAAYPDEPLESSGHARPVEQRYAARSTRLPRRRSDALPLSRTDLDPLFAQVSQLDIEIHGHDSSSQTTSESNVELNAKVSNVDVTKTFDLNDVKELARELRSATFDAESHHDALAPLVDLCRSNLTQLNDTIQRATMGTDSAGHDLGELLTIHELVTDTIEAAEKEIKDMESKDKSSHDKRDIFSLLCHLRSQKQKRYDAAWGLLRLTKKGTNEKRCHEIIASGGIKSLLTLFKASSESKELMMVSALTVVYLLPSLLDSDVPSANLSHVHMGVIECLQFLIRISRESTDIGISSCEIRTASAFAMTNLWFKVLGEKLRSSDTLLTNYSMKRFGMGESRQDPLSDGQFVDRRRRSSGVSFQTGEDVDCSILIDAFTSVAIMAAESEDSCKTNDMNVYYEFALIVESICAVEYARPIAMKEGVLPLLLKWLRSGDSDLERPAANAMRNLTLTQDDYTAGWVHSQLLNEKGLFTIVRRLESCDSRVRLAMAEAISSLTVAPHTRAGIVEARGVKYLVQLLGSLDIQARDEALALAAGNALVRLAIGAVAGLGGTPVTFVWKTQSSSKKESVIDDIIQNGALNSLVSMAKAENYGSLRFLSAKLLRVISEECKGNMDRDGTERQLCDAEAVSALGKILCRDITFIRSSVENRMASSDTSDLINDSLSNEFLTSTSGSAENRINEVRHALRGLVNILRPSFAPEEDSNQRALSDTQLRACLQLFSSGGVKSLLWIASMTQDACSKLEMILCEPSFCHDIQIDSCQALASLCPVILSPNSLSPGIVKWAHHVLSALVNVLKNQNSASIPSDNSLAIIPDIYVDVLQGLCCLAECEPLKMRIIDEFMPHLLELHRHENRNVSDAVTQVCLALGFNEVDSGAKDAYLLGDKFILARSRLLQAMVRDEIRLLLIELWTTVNEVRENEEHSYNIDTVSPLFPFLCQDQDTAKLREKVRQQYMNLYDYNSVPTSHRVQSVTSLGPKPMKRTVYRSGSYAEEGNSDRLNQQTNGPRRTWADTSPDLMENINVHALTELFANGNDASVENFLNCHQFPLNGSKVERDWVLGHRRALAEGRSTFSPFSPCLPVRVNDALRIWFPSALIQDEVIPLCGFSPNASFNFRALAMPSGRYFSFRREGQLVTKECENLNQSERVHCVLNFRNSFFAGEFTESLAQALYLCPFIQGLSFSNDAVAEENVHALGGSELLPFLARAIPSSVTHLTFDNVLSNDAALSLAHSLKSTYEEGGDEETVGSRTVKGSIHALAITNSPHINEAIFSSLVESIYGISSPLQYLRVLDLSGNFLGDAGSAKVLFIALSSSSSNAIERLDLSRNDIGEGSFVKGVLEECISNEPRLEVLNLSQNNFREGEVALQLAASLSDVLAKLKSIDISGNDLSGAFLSALVGCLSSNSHLVNLDISNNQFSSSSMNSFLSRLHNMSKSNTSTQLSFVHLGGNAPLLAPNQEMVLNEILSANRQRHVSTYREQQRNVVPLPLETDSDTNALSSVSDITGSGSKSSEKLPPAEVITVLFSAPLVWRDGDNAYHPIEMLDFKREKSLLWQCFSEASRNIDLSYDNATTDRLQAVMTRGCKYLHFSGHGHPYCLTFEDGSGGIHWFSVDQLKALISGGLEDGKPPFEFVFVSACHSALAGQTFVDCGVPHVVCCQQESQLMDSAALSFTRAFYLALAFGKTLRDSFEIGKHAVASCATVLKPEEEMEKFMLLPEDGNHDVPIFDAEEVREWPRRKKNGTVNYSCSNDSLPTPPHGFLGREADMYHTLNLVLNRRFVNIVGPTGMGRFSLAAALCEYIDDRKSTLLFDCIYFVKSTLKRPVVGKASPIISLHNKLVSAGKAQAASEDADLDEIIEEILATLKQTKSLLVFDKIESLDGTSEAQDFHFFLGQIFEQTKDVHVLVTSNQSIGSPSLVSVGESVYNLGPLNFRNTVKLFAFHCPHLHSSRERKELLDELVSHTGMNNRLAEDNEIAGRIKSTLGGGIPAKTFAVAYEITAEAFQDLKRVKEDQAAEQSQEMASAGEGEENGKDETTAEESQESTSNGEGQENGVDETTAERSEELTTARVDQRNFNIERAGDSG